MRKFRTALLFVLANAAAAQQAVTIRVHADRPTGAWTPFYRYFGYDEPNYTYMKNGRKLAGELASLSAEPVYIRTHFMLATGNGEPAFKWGSTNAYTENAGKPVYDWTIVDRILDTYLAVHAKPFVEIGFMPEALSSKPEPYIPIWSPGAAFDKYYVGWSYPPKDYGKWAELVYQWVRHEVEKHGRSEVASWYWEVWNEPDISYWHGTPEEYDKLYDYTADAVKRALPQARVGGPASTGPANARAASFLRQFLEHCATGKNQATGGAGSPLDFISYHAKGRPSVVDGHVRMGISKNLDDAEKGFEIVASFPKFRGLPIVLSESDPEGCAACGARVYPQNAYRNGPLYASYTAAASVNLLRLSEQRKVNLEGMLTWAFEFENQPYFEGFRTLATNGIDKPVLNVFRMYGLMRGERVAAESTAAIPAADLVHTGVRDGAYVDALASRFERTVSALVWNYHDDDVPAQPARIDMMLDGVPRDVRRVQILHYRIDADHSNAYAVWKTLGSPQSPSPEQYRELESAGQLQLLESPRWAPSDGGVVKLNFSLPRQAVSFVQAIW